jgi:hypothetical protein
MRQRDRLILRNRRAFGHEPREFSGADYASQHGDHAVVFLLVDGVA